MCDVLVANGVMFHRALDIDLPGRPPFAFTRYYSTDSPETGCMGWGWRHNLEVSLRIERESVVLRDGVAAARKYPFSQCDGRTGPKIIMEDSTHRVELRFPNGERLVFVPSPRDPVTWVLAQRFDRNGNWAHCGYEGGQPVLIADSEGHRVELAYRGDYLAELSVHHRGSRQTVRYDHDGRGRLVRILDSLGHATSFEYEDSLIVRHVDPRGVSRYFCYDELRKCVLNWYESGLRLRRLDFTPEGRVVVVRDSYGYGNVYFVGDNGQPVRLIDPLGRQTDWVYTSEGGLLCKILPDGGPDRIARWDSTERVRRTVDMAGSPSSYYFDESGRLARVENVLGHGLQFGYDERGNTADLVGPEGARWRFDYDARGSVVKIVYPSGYWIARSETDGEVRAWDELGPIGIFSFDGLGNLRSVSDALGRTTRYEYLGQDLPIRMIRPDGSMVQWAYDALGNITAVTDGLGRTTRYEYGPFGGLISVTQSDGRSVRYTMDREENVVAITNRNGEVARLDYDQLFRMVRVVYFDGRVDVQEFNDRSFVRRYTNGRGETMHLEYDRAGHIVGIRFFDGGVETVSWDALGRLESIEFQPPPGSPAPSNRNAFTYNGNHRVVREFQDGYEVEYDHDAEGRRVAVRDSLGREVRYRWGQRDLVERLEDGGRTFMFAYSPVGELVGIQLPNGMSQRFEFDGLSRLIRREVVSSSGTVVGWREYNYDLGDQLVRMRDWRLGEAWYAFDQVGRLTDVARGPQAGTEVYRYDAEGNLLSSPEFGSHVISPGNRLARTDASRFEYDGTGALVAWEDVSGRWEATYGPLNQLVGLRLDGVVVAEYQYDLTGRRVRKTCGEESTRFFHHVNLVASVQSPTAGQWDFTYVPGTFIPLAQSRNGQTWYYSFDQIGTPTELWSEEGRLIGTIEARAFGAGRRVIFLEGERVPVPFHFQGQFVDEESGLHYNRFRYYDPRTARYLTHDPIGISVGLNLYVYPRNPLNWIDPLGLQGVSMLVSCTPASGPPFEPCEQKALQEKMKDMNDQLWKRPGKKQCTKCRSDEQRPYFEEECKGQIPEGFHVDHIRELQVGGADLCCSNLMAIPARPNMSSGSQIRALLVKLGPDAIIMGAGIAPPGCQDAHLCNKPAVSRPADPKPCEDPNPINEPPC